ncbi:MAG: hypothetical protein EA414_00890 [Arthrospira sp. PLM2.Bin9]|nr:hypothetical protein [Arthrospira sp. PLM2.Bin9]TVU55593.1 MAG: hypothetical protein EA414_00890 [Arthrospira sp. PLM2.Bin9]
MKKLILSSVAVLGLSAAFSAPAEAQVIISSPPAGGSITGAASFTNFNGSTSAIAGQVTYPVRVFAEDVVVTLTDPAVGGAATGDLLLSELTVAPGTIDTATLLPGNGTSVEAAVATLISTSTVLNEQVSLIRAWRSGLD